jgi:hypothetical protein
MPAAARLISARKYQFTPELLGELRLAYCGNKHKLALSLGRLARRTGWPKHAFKTEACRQGWTAAYRPWDPDEHAFLLAHAGAMPAKEIALHLGRSYESVTARVEAILLARQTQEGYSPAHLQKLFGTSAEKVYHWIEKGLLGKPRSVSPEFRVSKIDLLHFIFVCHREYDLARVHQECFKVLVFSDKDKEI